MKMSSLFLIYFSSDAIIRRSFESHVKHDGKGASLQSMLVELEVCEHEDASWRGEDAMRPADLSYL